MIKLLRTLCCGIAIALSTATAQAQPGWPLSINSGAPAETPHPAIARIAAPNRDSLSLGSGTLVATNAQHALVITNWHVINEAAGVVRVIFPDGFQSGAVVLAADKDWDLAALVIWKPHAQPIPVARQIPQLGEPLTIAGYGSNSYRTATGRCTQFLSPGANFPNEIIELSAAARQGDSGGPILNARGELAGVLFGTASGLTSGSHCGRVSVFLASVEPKFRNPSPEGAAAAAAASRGQEAAVVKPIAPPTTSSSNANSGANTAAGGNSIGSTNSLNDDGFSPRAGTSGDLASTSKPATSLPYDPLPPLPPANSNVVSNGARPPLDGGNELAPLTPTTMTAPAADSSGWDDLVGHTLFQQFKTLMAVVGTLAVISQILRLGNKSSAKAKDDEFDEYDEDDDDDDDD